jgi:hypothetical protein
MSLIEIAGEESCTVGRDVADTNKSSQGSDVKAAKKAAAKAAKNAAKAAAKAAENKRKDEEANALKKHCWRNKEAKLGRRRTKQLRKQLLALMGE